MPKRVPSTPKKRKPGKPDFIDGDEMFQAVLCFMLRWCRVNTGEWAGRQAELDELWPIYRELREFLEVLEPTPEALDFYVRMRAIANRPV